MDRMKGRYIVFFNGEIKKWDGKEYPSENDDFYFVRSRETAEEVSRALLSGRKNDAYELAQKSLFQFIRKEPGK
jgi:hypothetical protein